MIRKVKAYLAHVFTTIITDEEVLQRRTMMTTMMMLMMVMMPMMQVLQRMSVEVEPPLAKASTHSISASSLRTGGNRSHLKIESYFLSNP